MRKINWPLIWLLTPWALCGCASRAPLAVPACPSPAAVPARLQIPPPPPEAFPACLASLLDPTYQGGLPSSCGPLQSYLSAIDSFKSKPEQPHDP